MALRPIHTPGVCPARKIFILQEAPDIERRAFSGDAGAIHYGLRRLVFGPQAGCPSLREPGLVAAESDLSQVFVLGEFWLFVHGHLLPKFSTSCSGK